MVASASRVEQSGQARERLVYQDIADNARAATASRIVTLTRFDRSNGLVRIVAQAGVQTPSARRALEVVRGWFPDFAPDEVVLPADCNPWNRAVYFEGRPVSAPFLDVTRDAIDHRIARMVSAMLGVRHLFVCPLKIEGEVAGGLAFTMTKAPAVIRRRACEAFARQASLTLENAHLATALAAESAAVQEKDWSFRQEQRRRQQLEAIRQMTVEMTRELDLSKLLELLTRRVTDLVEAESSIFALWDEASERLVANAWHGLGPWVGEVRLALGEGMMGVAAQTRRSLAVDDYSAAAFARRASVELSGIAAGYAEPIVFQDRLIGVIGVAHHRPGRYFRRQDAELLTIFASQAAVAIENARLFGDVQHLARRDGLTGVHNRHHFFFFARAEQEFEQAARHACPCRSSYSTSTASRTSTILTVIPSGIGSCTSWPSAANKPFAPATSSGVTAAKSSPSCCRTPTSRPPSASPSVSVDAWPSSRSRPMAVRSRSRSALGSPTSPTRRASTR